LLGMNIHFLRPLPAHILDLIDEKWPGASPSL